APAPSTPSAAPATNAPPTRAAARAASLEPEMAAIDHARAALASGDAPRCLRELEAYHRDFPRGVLGQEALVLRIAALVLAGDRAKARSLAGPFLRAHPNGPYARRIHAVLRDATTP